MELTLSHKIAAACIFAGVAIFVAHEFKLYLPELEQWIESLGAYGPLGFVVIFVVMSTVFVSIDALCFAAGVLFPLVTGELAVVIATYLAASLLYFLGQSLLREKIQAIIVKHKRFAMLNTVISGDNAFKLMFLLRLTPLPFAMLSYALSVMQIRFWPYLLASSGILIYNGSLVYLGYTTKHISSLIGGAEQKGITSYPMLVLSALMLIAAVIYIAKIAGKELKKLHIETVD